MSVDYGAILLEIRDNLNRRGKGRKIGDIHGIRSDIFGKDWRKKNSKNLQKEIFGDVHPERVFPFMFNIGGTQALQFNVGIDIIGECDLRYGLGLQIRQNQEAEVRRRIPILNKYMDKYETIISDLQMWDHSSPDGDKRRGPYAIAPVPADIECEFLFLGMMGRSAQPDYVEILNLFDRLMPMWESVEREASANDIGIAEPVLIEGDIAPGPDVTRSIPGQQIKIDARHRALQVALVDELRLEFGANAVSWEDLVVGGYRVDVVVKRPGERKIYEIKTAPSVRACIREAMGQLLDYGCWPRQPRATELIVVGERPCDDTAAEYLRALNRRFPIDISYKQIIVGE